MADAELLVRISADASDIENAIVGVGKQLSEMENASGKGAKAMSTHWQQSGKALKEFSEGVDTVTKPLQQASNVLAAGGVAAAKFAIDFEDSFASVKKTVEGTPEQLDEIKQSIIDMTTVGINGHSAIPLTTAELNELAAAGGQLGIHTENIADFTETMAMLGTATNLVGEQGAQTLARFMNVTNTSQDEISNLGSAIVDLGNNFATTEAEIADMAMEMGATGSVVGISAQNVLAYSTALSSLGVDAAAGGSSVSRIWMEIQNAVSAGGEDLQNFAAVSGKSAKEFAYNWKKDASGAFADFLKGLGKSEDQVELLGKMGFNNIRDIKALQLLAGDKGLELLNDALARSNSAWSENTALMNEFNAKADTTASKIAVAKNNLIEAGRSIGESFLPMVSEGAVKVAEFAKGIANMSDSQKQGLITTGKWVIGLGAASKGIAGTVKGVGGFVEGIGKIKTATQVGGALAKFAPALTAIGSAALPVAAGIAGVGIAAVAAKKGYDAWYDSQYRWTEGLSEGNEKIRESMERFKGLSAAQRDIKELKLIIENPESSKEEVESAKKKLEEIAALLEKEYGLKIDTGNGTEKLDETVEKLKNINKNEVQHGINEQTSRLRELKPKLENYKQQRAELEKQAQAALDAESKYTKLQLTLDDLEATYENTKNEKEYAKGLVEVGKALGMDLKESSSIRALRNVIRDGGIGSGGLNGLKYQADQFDKINKKIKDLTGTYEECKAISTEISNWYTELIGQASLEGNNAEVERNLEELGSWIRDAELDMHGYAIAAAEAMNGQGSLEKAWADGGERLDALVNDYVRASTTFGASAQETAMGASLLANGFTKIEEAADAGKLDVIAEQATTLAHKFKLIPEDKKITISAKGDVSLVDKTAEVYQEFDNKTLKVRINAKGNIDVINDAGEKFENLNGRAAYMQVNAAGNLEVFDSANQKIAEIDGKTGEVTIEEKVDSSEVDEYSPDDKDGTVEYEVDSSEVDKWTAPPKNGTVYYKAAIDFEPQARGTSDFSGGLAMINDQKGISDPRELVEVNGKGYLFEGRDVVLPLPKHSKVYTAAQTKAMMEGAGIPHYASGKDNDPWSNDKNAWQHRQRVSIVPLSAQDYLDWIDEMRKKYASNIEAMEELDENYASALKQKWDEDLENYQYDLDMGVITTEQYYDSIEAYRDAYVESGSEAYKKLSLEIRKHQQDLVKLANDTSKAWIDTRNAFNDWGDIGDSISDAYGRIEERKRKELEAGLIDYAEYKEEMLNATEQLVSGRVQYSYDWIEKEKKFNGMTADDAIAAIARAKATSDAFFASLGELTDEQYLLKLKIDDENREDYWAEVDNKIAEVEEEQEWYKRQAEVLGWGFNGTGHKSETEYWQAVMDKWQNVLDSGELNGKELNPTQMKEIARKRDEAFLNLYSSEQKKFEDILSQQKDAISDLESALSKQITALRTTWSAEDRAEDMEEVRNKLAIYENAATKEGRDEYERLRDELKRLEREETEYQLERENNALIAELNKQYSAAEEEQKRLLQTMSTSGLTGLNVDVSAFTQKINAGTDDIIKKLEQVTSVIEDIEAAAKNRNINVSQVFNNTISDSVDSDALALKMKRGVSAVYGGGH